MSARGGTADWTRPSSIIIEHLNLVEAPEDARDMLHVTAPGLRDD